MYYDSTISNADFASTGCVSCREPVLMPLYFPTANGASYNGGRRDIHHRIGKSFAPGSFYWRHEEWRTRQSLNASICLSKSSRSGVSVSSRNALLGWMSARVRVEPRFFPPELVVAVKAIACELPAKLDLPSPAYSCRTSALRSSLRASWPRFLGRRSGGG